MSVPLVQIDGATTVHELARVLDDLGLEIEAMRRDATKKRAWYVRLARHHERRLFEATAYDPVDAINAALRTVHSERVR